MDVSLLLLDITTRQQAKGGVGTRVLGKSEHSDHGPKSVHPREATEQQRASKGGGIHG